MCGDAMLCSTEQEDGSKLAETSDVYGSQLLVLLPPLKWTKNTSPYPTPSLSTTFSSPFPFPFPFLFPNQWHGCSSLRTASHHFASLRITSSPLYPPSLPLCLQPKIPIPVQTPIHEASTFSTDAYVSYS